MIDNNPQTIISRCKELRTYWSPRNEKMKKWYRLIQMVDELKTDKMESFVGNDPRSMFNLVLHLLTTDIPHRLESYDFGSMELAGLNESVSTFFDRAWRENDRRFRKSNPRQSLKRTIGGFLLATGWYAVFAAETDSGDAVFIEPFNPAEVFPIWDSFGGGTSELAHIFSMSSKSAQRMANQNCWGDLGFRKDMDIAIYDYWWVEDNVIGYPVVWNAIVIGDSNSKVVKFAPTRFKRIPIYVAPVGGLPDMGALSEGTELSTTSYNAGAMAKGERWKEEIGQAVVATNENIYRSWNKWWTFSLQLLRDTAQPAVFERSRSGKPIVKPENLFVRGAIYRGGIDDSVEFIGSPPVPIELRSTQLDLEAMMQRGGVSWAMYGNVTGQLSAYVMSQIAASANQIIKPFHQAIIDLVEDIDNDLIESIRSRGTAPYKWKVPKDLKPDMRITARYEIEIPGELIQKATVARMLDPEFSVSYSYVLNKLFPDIKNPLQERARILADKVELSSENAMIAAVRYYRKQAAILSKTDAEAARLYEAAAEAAEARLAPTQAKGTTRPAQAMGAVAEGSSENSASEMLV